MAPTQAVAAIQELYRGTPMPHWVTTALTLFVMGCSADSAIVRAEYGLSVPIVGAPAETVQTIRVDVGAIESGPGLNHGATVGFRARPFSKVAGGGALFDVTGITAWVPESESAPFVYGEAGFGLIGSTIVRRDNGEVGNTFDLFTPHATAGTGYGIGGGVGISFGVTVEYLWHVWDDFKPGNQVLLGGVVSVGMFDPRTPAKDTFLSIFE